MHTDRESISVETEREDTSAPSAKYKEMVVDFRRKRSPHQPVSHTGRMLRWCTPKYLRGLLRWEAGLVL